jgi:hypothetical protein
LYAAGDRLDIEKRGSVMDIGKPLIECGEADATALRQKMLALPEAFWELDTASRNRVAGDRSGRSVFFFNDVPPGVERNPLFEAKSGRVSVLRYSDRPLFAEVAALIEATVTPRFPLCDVVRVQLAELPPGGIIKPHRDTNILAVMHRLHVPVVTHEQVRFIIDWKPYILAPDRLYNLNNAMVHSVENNSDVMRVHLLIDLLPRTVAQARYFNTVEEMAYALAG